MNWVATSCLFYWAQSTKVFFVIVIPIGLKAIVLKKNMEGGDCYRLSKGARSLLSSKGL